MSGGEEPAGQEHWGGDFRVSGVGRGLQFPTREVVVVGVCVSEFVEGGLDLANGLHELVEGLPVGADFLHAGLPPAPGTMPQHVDVFESPWVEVKASK